MRTPVFWYKQPGLRAWVLAPLGWLYGFATRKRVAKMATAFKATCPVICVGNINAGGTGKTPTCMALVERLAGRGRKPVIVTRGHGGSLQGPLVVDPVKHTAQDVGDEPILLSAFCPVVVSKDRAQGAQLAQGLGDVIVLDDGHQNPSVQKDLTLVVVDAHRGFGNGFCIPAGPLRESVVAGLARADMLIRVGSGQAQAKFETTIGDRLDLPQIKSELTPLPTGMPWQGLPVVAFAGIGHPEKFFATLRDLGVRLIASEGLADHQHLTPALMKRLAATAATHGAQLVTTEKDAVRLPASFKSQVVALPVRLTADDWSALDNALTSLGV